MSKKYIWKVLLLCILLCQAFTKASAQYAIGGTAGPNLYNSVYWLTWNKSAPGSTLISTPENADATHIVNGTYVWQFSPQVRITANISNEVFAASNAMVAYTPGDYYADGLDLIYSANNLPKNDSRGVPYSGLATINGGTVTFDIDIKVSMLINNVWTDITYPGMVIGDAESIDVGGEYISGTTPSPVAWQLINKRSQGNAADDHYKMDLSNSGKSFKLYADMPPGNFGVQAVMFAHGVHNLTNVSMKGSGITAMAIGFVLPFDLGDDPATYGTTGHYIDNFKITDYFPGDGTYAVVNYNTTQLLPQARVFIGDDNVDPDGLPDFGVNANVDDSVQNNDEKTIIPANLPDIRVNQAGDVVLRIPVTNNKAVAATLYGWLDFNNDGIFAPDELIKVTVPANTINQTIALTYPNAMFTGKIRVGPLYTRLRITTTPLVDDTTTAADERSISFAADGEAEDYRLKDILGITVSGLVVNDGNGTADGQITGTGLQSLSGNQLYAYLVDNTNTIAVKAIVAADGSYKLTNANNGTYTVVVSTTNAVKGNSASSLSAVLPAGWQPSGTAYGVNNAGHTGLEPGVPDMQITVSTPGNSLDVSSVNFGVNQSPVSVADSAATTVGQPVTLDVTANDKDTDGTLDLTKVLLIDPADNTAKSSVTITGQGTYAVNTTTGKVTFTPVATFAGKATPLAYIIKDNLGAESASALISIIVKPVGVNDTGSTGVNTPVAITVKANDGEGATNTTVTVANGTHGTTAVDATGKVTYKPATGFIGVDTYTYTLTTADGIASDPIMVTITIKPAGVNDAYTTPVNTPVTSAVKSNDGTSNAGSKVTATNGAHGTTSVDAAGNVTYTPATDYIGVDTYTYTLTTADSIISDPITVTVSIKPVGVNDDAGTLINTPIVISVKNNDGASATGTTITPTNGAHGTVAVNADGTITYTPAANYTGTDTYTYTLTTVDGVVSDPVTVTVNVYTASMTLTKVATNGASKAGDVITYSLVVANTGTISLSNVVVTDAGADAGSVSPATISNLGPGTSVTVAARHTVTQAEVTAGSYSNQASVSGTDPNGNVITKDKSDNPNTTVADDPTVVIIAPAGSIGLAKTGVFTSYYITYTFVITNTGNSVLTNVLFTDTKLGLINNPVNIPTGGLLPGASVTNTVTYTLTQADKDAGTVSNTATVSGRDAAGNTLTSSSSTVTEFPKSPTATNDVIYSSVNNPTVIAVLDNDNSGNSSFNLEGVEIITPPAHGTVTVNANGTVTYTPNNGYSGPDVFTYRVKDLFGYYTNVATVTVAVSAASNLKIPTLFTPNGDGVNDAFEIRGLDQFSENELVIVNRWGNEVFRQSNYKNNWTGEGLNEGTYYYLLRVKVNNTWEVLKGYTTLMRSFKN